MLNVQQVADAAGISPETVRHHHKIATKARKEGVETERDLPAPSGVVDGANVWDDDKIAAWVAIRKTPARRGGVPKSEMRAILAAAENQQLDRVIAIARRNLS